MKKILILLFTIVSFWGYSQTLPNYWVPTSGTDTYTTGIPTFGSSFSNKQAFVKFGITNTGAATININSLGAKALKKWDGSAWVDLVAGDLKTTVVYKLDYDGTNFNVTGANLGDGAGSGGLEIAQVMDSIQNATDTLMALNKVQTVTAAKTYLDNTLLMRNVANTFSSRFTNTNTAARTYTLPDAAGTVALTSNLSGWVTGTLTGNVSVIGSQTQNVVLGSSTYANAVNNFQVFADNNFSLVSGDIAGLTTSRASISLDAGGSLVIGRADASATNINQVLINSSGFNFSLGGSTRLLLGTSNTTLNLGSDATGDMIHRNASGFLARTAKGSEGTLLRAGASVPAYSTFTIPNTISALSTFVSNSANVLTEVTPSAGQSIRINAGGTAWEAYTPGSGSGDVTKVGTPADNQVGVWTGDGTIEGTSGLTYNGTALNITGNITLSGTVDGIDIATDVAANTAKVTNATHTGDVTGSTALTIAAGAVDIAMLSATGTPSSTTFLRGDNTWAVPSGAGFTSGSNTLTANTDFTGAFNFDIGTSGSRVSRNFVYSTNSIVHNTLSTYVQTSAGSSFTSSNAILLAADSAVAIQNISAWPTAAGAQRLNRSMLGGIDVNSSSELYVMSESGAVVNLSGLPTPVTESGTSFTLNETHRGAFVYCTNAGAVTVTVPTGLPVGYSCTIVQLGAGTVSLSASGTTIVGATSTSAQYKPLPIHQYGTNTFIGY